MRNSDAIVETAQRWLSRKPQTYSSAAELAAFDIIYDLTKVVEEQAAALSSAQQAILLAELQKPIPIRWLSR